LKRKLEGGGPAVVFRKPGEESGGEEDEGEEEAGPKVEFPIPPAQEMQAPIVETSILVHDDD
jgi:hypothetical protein